MSREIHDTLAQGFTSLLMLIQAVQTEVDADAEQAHRHLELMASTARENLAEARALVAGGAPADLAGGSLPDAVRRLAARHTEQTRAPVAVEVTGTVRGLPAAVEVVALRTCQEALANARRHAGAKVPVDLQLRYEPGALVLAVRDEGCGFDPGAVAGAGYGLPGLRARAAELGGSAGVRSAPGEGTTVSVRLPVVDGSAAKAAAGAASEVPDGSASPVGDGSAAKAAAGAASGVADDTASPAADLGRSGGAL
jgi:signal transduction histidine kinase